MKEFENYYNDRFRKDITMFFSTIPDESKFHEDKVSKLNFSIQHERLSRKHQHLDFLDHDSKLLFGVALYFTVLTDMVCYTYYQRHYGNFQKLTQYPKLIGNCLSWCRFHLDPKDIFSAMNFGARADERHLDFREVFKDATAVMRDEILSFFNNYFPVIDAEEFWQICQREIRY